MVVRVEGSWQSIGHVDGVTVYGYCTAVGAARTIPNPPASRNDIGPGYRRTRARQQRTVQSSARCTGPRPSTSHRRRTAPGSARQLTSWRSGIGALGDRL